MKVRSKHNRKYLILMIVFLIMVNASLGYLLMRQARSSIITLMQTRMLDISNTAAGMIDGEALKSVSPADAGTDGYETIMRTLTYFQDNIELRYIYCIRDMGDGTFTFGLDPTVEDPGEFGSPIVYTDALYKASKGTASADETYYEDAWGKFYSAYSPVFDKQGQVAGIIAVDFDAAWYDQQLATLTRTTIIVALLSLLVGGSIVVSIITRSEKRISSIQSKLNELNFTLMQEMGNGLENGLEMGNEPGIGDELATQNNDITSMDSLAKQIQSMQTELKTQIAQVHIRAYQDGLTGVKSKHAYIEDEKTLNKGISDRTLSNLGIVVCDVNGLKKINDSLGHKAGDEYICKASKMICDVFSHSPAYRIGGDEFVVVLTGRDYDNRTALIHELHSLSSAHIQDNGVIVSGGLSEYIPDHDTCVRDIFERADATMYEEKMILKSLGAAIRDDEQAHDSEFDISSAINVRKHILIADDMDSNREMLGDLLQDDYDIYYASDGVETLEMLRQHKEEIALVLLDLYMPNMSGREVLSEMQVNDDLMAIPVIVLTVDENAELDCLKIGAMDFIPKPYPDIEIIKARISVCVELSESRNLIHDTQRDRLTELYNIDYFIRYVKLFDQTYEDTPLDVILCDVNHFHSINAQYGRQFGDLVLHSIGRSIRKLARKTGGIGCRQGGDTFLIYCPHQDNYEQLLDRFLAEVFVEKDTSEKVSLRFGIFENAGSEPDIEKRFINAQIAADSVEDEPSKVCGYYTL